MITFVILYSRFLTIYFVSNLDFYAKKDGFENVQCQARAIQMQAFLHTLRGDMVI